jgi:hypothetical protein
LCDLFKLDLEPDGEEQHEHTQMRDTVEDLVGIVGQTERRAKDIDGKPSGEKTHERRQADLADGQTEKERETNDDDFEQCATLPFNLSDIAQVECHLMHVVAVL